MTSSVRLILGVSILAASVGINAGCGSSSSPTPASGGGPVFNAGAPGTTAGASSATAGAPSTTAGAGGTPGVGAAGAGGGTGGTPPAGIAITPMDGWVDAASNGLGIQGAVFPYADPYSILTMMSDFTGMNACVKGTAAKVDMTSVACTTKMFTSPGAVDCFGEYWGAAVGLNLNQPTDMVTMMGGTPMPFDASALTGFYFELSGTTVPAAKDLRFKVENAMGEFCTPTTKKLSIGGNTVLFSELLSQCYKISTMPPNPTAETAKAALIKIGWAVVTNTTSAVPFDFCISNIRALM